MKINGQFYLFWLNEDESMNNITKTGMFKILIKLHYGSTF